MRPTTLLPSLARAPRPAEPNVLATFVRERARGWGAVAAPLSDGVTAALCGMTALTLLLGGWLAAVRVGAVACSGLVCTVVTLGDHAQLTLVLALTCAGVLGVAMTVTDGLARANGPQLVLVVGAALCGVVALAGVIAVLLFTALCLAVACGLLVVVADRL